jgi:molybdenum transport protein
MELHLHRPLRYWNRRMPYTNCCLTTGELESLLQEDAPYGDLTVAALAIGRHPGRINFAARDPMTVCGIEEAARLFELAGAEVSLQAASGDPAEPGRHLLRAEGPADALFRTWKVAQSLVESLAGISSCARLIVERASDVQVACTRKHLPGNKAMMVKAVLAGGAAMHRLGLSESIMVTAEHRTFLDGESSHAYLPRIRGSQPEKKCVVEVDSVEAALSLLQQGCDVIQLEKLSVDQVAAVVAAAEESRSGPRPVIAAAGGVNPDNAAAYAATGVDLLVTSAPYFAKPRDVQVRFEAL